MKISPNQVFLNLPGLGKLKGFSLVEMGIVLVILSLLIGFLLVPLSTQREKEGIETTQRTMEEIQKALLGYAIRQKGLPCPDRDGDGIGEIAACDANDKKGASGYLPWVDLGVGRYDAWGHPFLYRLDSAYGIDKTGNKSSKYDPKTSFSNLQIKNKQGKELITSDQIVAIIFSYGKNGKPDGDNPQAENEHENTTYIQDVYIENEFDDIVVWLSKNTLVEQWAATGMWPLP